MIIRNDKLLAEFRTPGRCVWCKKWCKVREGAHIFSRGGGRCDIRCNLLPMGSTKHFECPCHSTIHNKGGVFTIETMLHLAAVRERVEIDDIEDVIYFFRRLPKNCDDAGFAARLEEIGESAGKLARREWQLWRDLTSPESVSSAIVI